MVGVIDEYASVVAAMPKSITVANGDVILLPWQPSDEYFADQPHPYGVVEPVDSRTIRTNDILIPDEQENQTVENILFATGTDVYQVTERDIVSINGLTATVATVPDTPLVEGTDFEVFRTSDYWTDNAIRFLAGGTKPDDATQFGVDYQERRVRSMRQMISDDVWRAEIMVKSLPSGQRGATKAYTKSYLAKQLADGLAADLDTRRGENIVPADPILGTQFRFNGFQTLGKLPVDDGESLIRWGVDIVFRRRRLTPIGSDRTIGSLEDPTYTPTV